MAPTKRKNPDHEASLQRLVAQKLHLCADVKGAFLSTQQAQSRQWHRFQAQHSQVKDWSRFRGAMAQVTHFQTLWATETLGDPNTSERAPNRKLRNELDHLLTHVANPRTPVPLRIEKIVARLPRLIETATGIVSARRHWLQEQQALPIKHQWVPMVLWKIYDQVEKKDHELKALKTAMHHVMKTVKELNPYFYLQVRYQAPPENLGQQWNLIASENLMNISATMTPYFQALKTRSSALVNQNDSFRRIHDGWNQLRVTLTFVHRAARHFHCLILHLYAMTMGREEPHVHAGIISEKAATGILRDDAKLRSRLRLCRRNANSEDYLLMESYEWTPELLIFLDKWRHHRDNRLIENIGFDRRERKHDFLPRFSSSDQLRQDSGRKPRKDVLAEIGYHLACVQRVWRKSLLGTTRFRLMRIEDIGVLEKKIKGSLGMVVELVYKMMLARWMDRKKRPDEWWASLQFVRESIRFDCEYESLVDCPDNLSGDYSVDLQENSTQRPLSGIVDLNENLQDAIDGESLEHKNIGRSRVQSSAGRCFRRPSKVTFVNHVSASEKEATELSPPHDLVIAKPLVFAKPIHAHDIYAWTDKDIGAFTRDTKRMGDVRAAMVGLCNQFNWLKASREATSVTEIKTKPAFEERACDAWRAVRIASHLCTLTKKAASFAEEAAIFEAASALTMERSLRVTGGNSAIVEDDNDLSDLHVASDESNVKELREC